jgi:hypothetical protein
MLVYAKKHEDRLRQLFMDTAFDPFYQFEQFMVYRETFKLPDDTYNANHFVSVYDNEIIGLIGYQLRRAENAAWGLQIIHFGGPEAPYKYIFGKDVLTAVKNIFEKYGFNKINFGVAIGNPIERTYDKLVKRYNGRIVGIKKQDIRLLDGRIYDVKEYEILAIDYFWKKIWPSGVCEGQCYESCVAHDINHHCPYRIQKIDCADDRFK